MSASWEVQKVLYDQLKADTTFMNLITNRLYDEPNTNENYPYVTVGNMIEANDNSLSYRGYETTAIFDIYTKPAKLGFYSAKQILEEMNRVLNMKKFSMDTLTMIICMYDNSIAERDKDKRIISVSYKVLTDSNTLITF